MIAGLANHHQCPVLSNDSDFYIFNLKNGFIQIKDCYSNRRSVRVYNIRDFMVQYNLREYELCLLIPILHFNESDDIRNCLECISKYNSIEEFLTENENTLEIKESYEMAEKSYCNLQIPSDICEKLNPLPRWIFFKFRRGLFAGNLLKAYCSKSHRLPEIVEDVERESAWRISRPIRRFLFGFMGISSGESITEKTRNKYEIVKPIHFESTITCNKFHLTCERDVKTLKQIVLIGLQCHAIQKILDIFSNYGEDQWKLPVAVTRYWYREQCRYLKLSQCNLLLKSLLLSFLKCSGVIQNDIPFFKKVDKASIENPMHLMALHAFAEWQCVYHDARALNYAAREPFPTTSPACFYSGSVAMYYATVASHEGDWVNDILVRGSDEWVLFNKLLLLITEECGMYYSRVRKSPRRPFLEIDTACSLEL